MTASHLGFEVDPRKLVLARARARLSQREVARRTRALGPGRGVDHSNLAKWERGDRVPYVHSVADVAEVLGIDVAELFRDEPKPETETTPGVAA